MIYLVLLCIFGINNGQSIQVETVEGVVEGYKAIDGDYYSFHGIPYAEPRVGPDMFKPSAPLSSLSGLLHANKSGIQCAHPGPDGMVGVIDCLVLNVFTSNVTASRPVLVWLNGEESDPTVSSKYSFKNLVAEDLVVVTLNYRLSVFGFLCLRTKEHPGNAGLRDVILGLEWIQRNIAGFGGNPDNVILIGHGMAAAVVDIITVLISPYSYPPRDNKLFHKVIALSGSAMAPWAVTYDPLGAALALNRVIGGAFYFRDEIPVHFASRTLDDIYRALTLDQFQYMNNTNLFASCLENTNAADFLLASAPFHYLRMGLFHTDVPYMAGYMTKEGTQRAKEVITGRWLEQMDADFTRFLPVDLVFENNREKRRQAQNIRNFYVESANSSIDAYLNYYGDTLTVVPLIRGLRLRAISSTAGVYLLKFGHMGTNNSDWNYDPDLLNGARHGIILNYIFNFDLTTFDQRYVANTIIKRISNFAYTGVPKVFNDTLVNWRPFTNETLEYLLYEGKSGNDLDVQHITTSMQNNPHEAEMQFWDQLYNMYYTPPSSGITLTGLTSLLIASVAVLIIV